MTTLIVAAHPDDEVLGCGGTITRLAGQGEEVHIAILGEGSTSRAHSRSQAEQESVHRLAQASDVAAGRMGAHRVVRFGLPDNRFDTVALLDVVKLVEGLIVECSPSAVITQHGGDLNVDHRVTFRAVLAATRPLPGHVVKEVLAFEVGSSTEWSFQQFAPVFRPSVFVDITETLNRKVAALLAYEDEVRAFPHPRSPEAVRAAAARWGATAGVLAAEAFELIRMVR